MWVIHNPTFTSCDHLPPKLPASREPKMSVLLWSVPIATSSCLLCHLDDEGRVGPKHHFISNPSPLTARSPFLLRLDNHGMNLYIHQSSVHTLSPSCSSLDPFPLIFTFSKESRTCLYNMVKLHQCFLFVAIGLATAASAAAIDKGMFSFRPRLEDTWS